MKDTKELLEKQGPNTQHPDMFRFTHVAMVLKMEAVIRSYLKEAMGYAEAGIKPPKDQRELELPLELVEAMAFDAELAYAFERLTLGRQKSYVINLNSAKKSETKIAHRQIPRSHSRRQRGSGTLILPPKGAASPPS
jgi:uncharacterized protein YdeI (YjbR/CyaY-like superfamily)